MPNLTPNYSFNLPLVADPIDADLWGGQLNANWTALDTLLEATGISPVGALEVLTDAFTIADATDDTKKLAFNVSAITTGTTRTLSVQDASGTLPVIVSGSVSVPATATSGSSIVLAEDTDNGANTVTVKSQDSLGSNIVVTLPTETATLAIRPKQAILTYQVAAGGDGGTATTDAWTTRPINTETDPDSIVTLASNQFQVATTGTYEIGAIMQFFSELSRILLSKARIYNVTDGVVVAPSITGGIVFPTGTSGNVPVIIPSRIVTLTAGKDYALQYYTDLSGGSTRDLGYAYGNAASAMNEVYAQVTITYLYS